METIRVNPATWLAENKRLAGPAEVVFADGVYVGITVTPAMSGSVFRAENAHKARISNQHGHGVYIAAGTASVRFDGFNLAYCLLSGLKAEGAPAKKCSGVSVENCWVHSNGLNGIEGHFNHTLTVRGCVVEFNGINPQYHHGIYADGVRHRFEQNIVRRNAGNGFSLGPMLEMVMVDNLVHDNGGSGVYVTFALGSKPSEIIRNTLADNREVDLLVPEPKTQLDRPGAVIEWCVINEDNINDNVAFGTNASRPAFVNYFAGDYRLSNTDQPQVCGVPPALLPVPGDWTGGYAYCADPRDGLPLSLINRGRAAQVDGGGEPGVLP